MTLEQWEPNEAFKKIVSVYLVVMLYLRSKKVRPYVETTPIRSSICDLVSATKLYDFDEIQHFFYEKLLGKRGFREIRRNDRHTILKDVN